MVGRKKERRLKPRNIIDPFLCTDRRQASINIMCLRSLVGYVPPFSLCSLIMLPPSRPHNDPPYLIGIIAVLTLSAFELLSALPFRIGEISENPFNFVLSHISMAYCSGITTIPCSP